MTTPTIPEWTPADLAAFRARTGLSIDWLDVLIDVHRRTIRRWGKGTAPIAPGCVEGMQVIDRAHAILVADATTALHADPFAGLLVYDSTRDLHESLPILDPYPASFHRSAMRAAVAATPDVQGVPTRVVEHADAVRKLGYPWQLIGPAHLLPIPERKPPVAAYIDDGE